MPIDYTGRRFGRLTVLREAERRRCPTQIYRVWFCRCDCGKMKEVIMSSLGSGKTTSCGCHQKEIVSQMYTTHGMSTTSEFSIWQEMGNRCYNLNHKNYFNYGGRGISVCERWRNSFVNFFQDMGFRPTTKHSLDREENNGNYEPSNCRWATGKVQGKNKRSNVWLTYKGNRMIQSEWAIKLNTKSENIGHHLKTKTFEEVVEFFIKKKNIKLC